MAYFEEDYEPIELEFGNEINELTERYANNLTKKEIYNKLDFLIGSKYHGYDPADLKTDARHRKDFGLDLRQYLELAERAIKNSEKIACGYIISVPPKNHRNCSLSSSARMPKCRWTPAG